LRSSIGGAVKWPRLQMLELRRIRMLGSRSVQRGAVVPWNEGSLLRAKKRKGLQPEFG
jgi:hypothetical protein